MILNCSMKHKISSRSQKVKGTQNNMKWHIHARGIINLEALCQKNRAKLADLVLLNNGKKEMEDYKNSEFGSL